MGGKKRNGATLGIRTKKGEQRQLELQWKGSKPKVCILLPYFLFALA